jgi:hypothetical protein
MLSPVQQMSLQQIENPLTGEWVQGLTEMVLVSLGWARTKCMKLLTDILALSRTVMHTYITCLINTRAINRQSGEKLSKTM